MGSCAGRVYAFDVYSGDTLWTYDASRDGATQFHGAPALDENTIVIGTDEGNEDRGTLYALDRMSGSVRWKLPADPGVPSNLVSDGGRVYGVDRNSTLLAVDRGDGSVAWRFEPRTDGRPMPDVHWLASNPVIHGDLVIFAGHDNTVHGVDLTTGEPRWSHAASATITSQLCLARDRIVFGTNTPEMVELDTSDGSPVAFHPLAYVPAGELSYRDSLLAYCTGEFPAPPRYVNAFDLDAEQPVWTRGVPDPDPETYWSVPRMHFWQSTLVVGSSAGLILALNPRSGETVWTAQVDGVIRGIGHAGDTLLVGTFEGILYALKCPDR